MADVNTILNVEKDNFDRIHLFREGLFLKAYQRSAFLFLNNIKEFRTIKKFFKAAGADVVMIGFPSKLLETIIVPEKIEQIDEWHSCIPCDEPLRENEYQAWFNSIPLTPVQEKKRQKKDAPDLFEYSESLPQMSVRVFEPQGVGDTEKRVIRELQSFPLENSTPMECMNFVSKLKMELKKGGTTSGSV